MNYRHGYHAGNFADLLKHTALCELLRLMTSKDKKLFVLDTHAGAGGYDLAADKAGTRLGELAVRDPERLAAAVAAGLTDSALLPSIHGLPESMQSAEFQRRFGGVGGPAYTRMSDEIDRRIAAMALFR